jgi:hypothetical protein
MQEELGKVDTQKIGTYLKKRSSVGIRASRERWNVVLLLLEKVEQHLTKERWLRNTKK